MIYLVLYDISNDRIRTKVAKSLIAEGFERIQLSVFLGTVNPKENIKLWNELQKWLSAEPHSKLLLLPLTKNNFRKMLILGDFFPDIDYLTGNKHSLFI